MTKPARPSRPLQVLLIAGLISLAACSKADDSAASADNPSSAPAATGNTGEEDLADVARYQLTMDKYDKYLAAQKNISLMAKGMSPAEIEAMKARQDGRDDSNESLEQMAKNIEAEPRMVAAIRDAGLSPREFAVLTVSIMQTAMAAGIAKMRPNDNQDSLIREMKANPANVKFFSDNEAELTRKQNELAAELKRLGVSDEN